jgi:hypothetical protein
VTLDPGGRWASVWEEIKVSGFMGTGIALPAGAVIQEIRSPKTPDTSHVLGLVKTDASGRIRFRAGFALVKASRITSPEAWQQTLAKAAEGL